MEIFQFHFACRSPPAPGPPILLSILSPRRRARPQTISHGGTRPPPPSPTQQHPTLLLLLVLGLARSIDSSISRATPPSAAAISAGQTPPHPIRTPDSTPNAQGLARRGSLAPSTLPRRLRFGRHGLLLAPGDCRGSQSGDASRLRLRDFFLLACLLV